MPPKKCLVNPNLRMDGLKNTVAEYGEGMARFSKNLQQAIDRRKSLQEKLLKEKKLTSQAKVQLEVLKAPTQVEATLGPTATLLQVKRSYSQRQYLSAVAPSPGVLKEHEEREKCQETVLNEMKATADRVRSALDQKLTRERELREQLDAKVSEIEGVSRDILFKFRNLKLRDTCQDEEDESKIDEDIISLENEISVIQQEKISLLQKMDDRLKVDELKLILNELDVSVLAVTEERNALKRTVAKLEEELKQLNSEKTALADEGSAIAEGNVCSGE
ncbi:myosin heavy chain, clone 203-like isoform X2 [Macrobrachium rosenbergii]|uniref:myosin heavy chain, clone 203-like isoform X2 n=1 Tax=Macrobrachium rosenbergii TaxID=79674 RepID=UPI0034D3DFB0